MKLSDLRTISVVLVDDRDDLRGILRMAMAIKPQFEVVGEAADGRDAIDVAARTQPDVMLLDLSMPGMNGFEALPLIRRVSPRTRVIVLSSLSEKHVAPMARQLGAALYLQKGTGLVTLLGAVERVSAQPVSAAPLVVSHQMVTLPEADA